MIYTALQMIHPECHMNGNMHMIVLNKCYHQIAQQMAEESGQPLCQELIRQFRAMRTRVPHKSY